MWTQEYKEHGEDSFPGSGLLKPCNEELYRLKKQLGRAQVNLDPLEIEKIPCISDPMFKALKRKITMGF
jgi:hypothetical protein